MWYVKDQTPEICLEAVKQNASALQCVENQTDEICIAAINNNIYAIKFVENLTPVVCKEYLNLGGVIPDFIFDKLGGKKFLEKIKEV